MITRSACRVFLALSVVSPSVSADLAIYDLKDVFLSDTGATSATGPLPSVVGSAVVLTVGSVTFTPVGSASMIIGQSSPSHFGTSLLVGNEITLVGNENLNFVLASAVYSFGFDFAEPNVLSGCGVTCVDSTFTVSLLREGELIDQFTFNAPNGVASFVGAWTDALFDRVEVRETTGSADSEFFGEVYTGVKPVPVPGALFLLAPALGGLGMVLRSFAVKGVQR